MDYGNSPGALDDRRLSVRSNSSRLCSVLRAQPCSAWRLRCVRPARKVKAQVVASQLTGGCGKVNAVSQRAETPLGLQAVLCPNELCRKPAPRFVPVYFNAAFFDSFVESPPCGLGCG